MEISFFLEASRSFIAVYSLDGSTRFGQSFQIDLNFLWSINTKTSLSQRFTEKQVSKEFTVW